MSSSSSLPPNLFTAAPTPPPTSLNLHPPTSLNLPPLPPRRRRPNPTNLPNPNPSHAPQPQGGLLPPRRSPHYRKPIRNAAESPSVLPVDSQESGRAVVVGPSGVGFRLPGAPFDFQYSYSETPLAAPIAIREPAVLPFAAPTMPRPWTGKAPLLSKKEKAAKKGLRLFRPLGHDDSVVQREDGGIVLETRGRKPLKEHLGMRFMVPSEEAMTGRSREEVLGAPLCSSEIAKLVRPHISHNRQLNIGRDGVTHNMLEMVHCHWRRQEVCKVRCRGVPTIDMDNICRCLEEKTGGKVILQKGGVVFLYRGRNYDPRRRPRYPIMLWKPAAPVYPKLIQEAPEGLTKEEADAMRLKGQNLPPICKLSKNGIYINLLNDVRDAFEGCELVKINCKGMHASDYKKLGAKLKELVPCVLLSFDDEQILMWRGAEWRSRYPMHLPHTVMPFRNSENLQSDTAGTGTSGGATGQHFMNNMRSSRKMVLLWKRAINSLKALLIDESDLSGLGPDSLLKMVEDFAGASQAVEHSYPALLVADSDNVANKRIVDKSKLLEVSVSDIEEGSDELGDSDKPDSDDNYLKDIDDFLNSESSLPLGSLAIDSITRRLGSEE